MAEFPNMTLWTDAYLADTRHLSTTEHGAYLLLLIVHWRIGPEGLPDDEKLLARYSGLSLDKWRRMAPTIRDFFDAKAGRLVQARLVDEYWHVKRQKEKSAAGGHAKALKTNERRSARSQSGKRQNAAPLPLPSTIEKEEPNGSSKKRGTRLPDDWQPIAEDHAFAINAGMGSSEVMETAAQFRDYWLAQPGQRGVKLDWSATWRNWVRNEAKRAKPANGKAKMVSASGYEYRGSLEEIKRMAAKRRDSDTEWECEKRLRQEREAQPLGNLVGKIVAGVRQ